MFDVEHTPTALRITMSASLHNIDRADQVCLEELDRRQVAVNRFALRILLREAALNAVTHGCGEGPDGRVCIAIVFGDDGLRLIVEDNGPGFIWQNREVELDVQGDGGRGLPLMRIYSSEMIYNQSRNRVELRLRSDPELPVTCGNRENGGMP